MKILIVNASDTKGGAAVVAHRLLHALNTHSGVSAKMLVADKMTGDPAVIALPRTWWLRKLLDRLLVFVANGFSMRGLWWVDGGFLGNDITQYKEFIEADIIHLHWVNQGMLGLRDIERIMSSGKRIVWTMHDAWLTLPLGHHEGQEPADTYLWQRLKKWVTKHKTAMLDSQVNDNLHLVACSTWMAEAARRSSFTCHLPVTVIPNVFDCSGKAPVRNAETGKKQIVFVAARIDDEIKGFDDLLSALDCLRNRKDIELVLIGRINNSSLLQRIPIPYHYLGFVHDSLSVIASATCLVSCSRCETLPTTIVEAQAVGVTPVAYAHSGALDLITDGKTGYFAEYRNTESLAHSIERALDAPLPPDVLYNHVITTYSADTITRQYLNIYQR